MRTIHVAYLTPSGCRLNLSCLKDHIYRKSDVKEFQPIYNVEANIQNVPVAYDVVTSFQTEQTPLPAIAIEPQAIRSA